MAMLPGFRLVAGQLIQLKVSRLNEDSISAWSSWALCEPTMGDASGSLQNRVVRIKKSHSKTPIISTGMTSARY